MAVCRAHAYTNQVYLCIVFFTISVLAQEQNLPNSPYREIPPWIPQNARDYQTYFYNGRRYGQQPNYLDPLYRGPTRAPEDRFRFGDTTPRIPLPGVLGGWREDLQGKERADSRTLDRDVFVTTNYGQVQGFKVYLYDHPEARHRPWSVPVERVTSNINVFLGIPYATPPTKEGRFKPPRPHRGWQLLQAVDWGPACPQPSRYTGVLKGIPDVDEDCLYLNIFTPNIESGMAKRYSVMVYIHGGEFVHGASNLFPAHILAGFYDVVVVSLNYRLGVLGFLSTGDENSPGNYGVLDQALALRWVYDNILYFNGDPESITLFGPGAGAASAGLLMVAPRTRDLVAKVIAQSGSALADWAIIPDKYRAQNTSRVYGELVGCPIESSWKLVQCLKDSRGAIDLSNSEFKPHVGMFPWGPVLDHNFTVPRDNWYEDWRASDWHFFTEMPEDSIKNRKFRKDLAYMTSVTTQEAAFMIFNNATLARNQYIIDPDIFDQKVRELVLRYNYTLNPLGVYEAIKYMYTYWPDPNNVTYIRDQYINLLSDFHYVAPMDKMVKLLVEQNVPVYIYVLNTTIEALRYPFWRRVPHDIEHLMLSGAPFMDVEFFPKNSKLDRRTWTDNDRNMSHFFMKAYSNFARFGNPTPSQIVGLHFDMARQGQLRYLNINTTFNSSILINYRQTESAFWSMYLPTVIGRLVPTYPPVTEYWWEPKQPLQIAFWSMSTACLLLIVLSVICCMLWRNAKRQSDHYYSGDVLMIRDDTHSEGIENLTQASKENVYEYRDAPTAKSRVPRQNESKLQERLAHNRKFSSTPSLRTNSNVSLRDMQTEGFVTSSPNGHPKLSKTRSQTSLPKSKSKTHLVQGVPQTAV
ncbi:cholinesterase isoform X1 [Athalia rosae]|uniref:cholinesterase isoform X1 n=2 Tax=Athalia rosae TaxID=37344 RepID=UPI00203459DA|nr:cholinesterase isoform X1 [Athalia rosae]XP_048508757.1 cholinesterase isoform X1 [Athalia rosae]XP_048508764.1 cholinesterase isoform X1 [Athalia rosae]XP_048508766.1 cholinesterase isoform X1 [Athalia rosae]